jgi:hypothetical protein
MFPWYSSLNILILVYTLCYTFEKFLIYTLLPISVKVQVYTISLLKYTLFHPQLYTIYFTPFTLHRPDLAHAQYLLYRRTHVCELTSCDTQTTEPSSSSACILTCSEELDCLDRMTRTQTTGKIKGLVLLSGVGTTREQSASSVARGRGVRGRAEPIITRVGRERIAAPTRRTHRGGHPAPPRAEREAA